MWFSVGVVQCMGGPVNKLFRVGVVQCEVLKCKNTSV